MPSLVYTTVRDVIDALGSDFRDALFIAVISRGEVFGAEPGRLIQGMTAVPWDLESIHDPKARVERINVATRESAARARDLQHRLREILEPAEREGRVLWPRDFHDRPSDDGRRMCFEWVSDYLRDQFRFRTRPEFRTGGDYSGYELADRLAAAGITSLKVVRAKPLFVAA